MTLMAKPEIQDRLSAVSCRAVHEWWRRGVNVFFEDARKAINEMLLQKRFTLMTWRKYTQRPMPTPLLK